MVSVDFMRLVRYVARESRPLQGKRVLYVGDHEIYEAARDAADITDAKRWFESRGASVVVASWSTTGQARLVDIFADSTAPEWGASFDIIILSLSPAPPLDAAGLSAMWANVSRWARRGSLVLITVPEWPSHSTVVSVGMLIEIARSPGFNAVLIEQKTVPDNTSLSVAYGVFSVSGAPGDRTDLSPFVRAVPPPAFSRASRINACSVWVTSVCDRRCAWCFARIPERETRSHFPPEYFARVGPMLTRCEHVLLTGGEPTSHPQLDEVLQSLRRAGCGRLLIESNGYRVARWADAIGAHVDEVHVSWYTSRSYPGAADNTLVVNDAISALRSVGVRVVASHVRHVPDLLPSDETPRHMCARGSSGRAIVVGDIAYPCCSVDPSAAQGVPLVEGWESAILAAPVPCGRCRFGVHRTADDHQARTSARVLWR